MCVCVSSSISAVHPTAPAPCQCPMSGGSAWEATRCCIPNNGTEAFCTRLQLCGHVRIWVFVD